MPQSELNRYIESLTSSRSEQSRHPSPQPGTDRDGVPGPVHTLTDAG